MTCFGCDAVDGALEVGVGGCAALDGDYVVVLLGLMLGITLEDGVLGAVWRTAVLTASCNRSSLRPVMYTLAPLLSRVWAMMRPRPEPPLFQHSQYMMLELEKRYI